MVFSYSQLRIESAIDKTWKGIGVAWVENRSALPAGWGSVMGWSADSTL
jgi:hypothetical protein